MSETTEATAAPDADAALAAAAAAKAAGEDEDTRPVVMVTRIGETDYSAVDAGGRTLVLRKLDQAETADLYEAAEDVLSVRWIMQAQIACSVRSIDGVPVPLPGNKNQIRALLRRLGDAGMDVAVGVSRIQSEKRVMNRYTVAGENPAIAKN